MNLNILKKTKATRNLFITIIAAISKNGYIGKEGQLPWNVPSDLEFFKEQTLNSFVIMGRGTYESIGRPLASRVNIVITTNYKEYIAPGCIVVKDLNDALKACLPNCRVFICGGANVYAQFLPLADNLILNELDLHVDGDTKFPVINQKEWFLWKSIPHKQDGEPSQLRKFFFKEESSI